ncbi:hypothetical protein Hanom_Chr01g00009441 [Helianthus anomalus]
MEPIKSNHHPSQYPPLDHAEMKSQPFKLAKITALMEVICSFLLVVLLQKFRPMISTPLASFLLIFRPIISKPTATIFLEI